MSSRAQRGISRIIALLPLVFAFRWLQLRLIRRRLSVL
jgi:hypothetical protein